MKKCLSVLLVALLIPVVAQADIKFQGWGPRMGLSVDPDQLHVGVQFDLGEFVPHLQFQPNVELGFGDDVFLLLMNGETFYLFDLKESNVALYAGGELSLAYWHVDTPRSDTDDLELSLSPVGGVEIPFSDKYTGFFEMKIGLGDVPDFRLTVGVFLW